MTMTMYLCTRYILLLYFVIYVQKRNTQLKKSRDAWKSITAQNSTRKILLTEVSKTDRLNGSVYGSFRKFTPYWAAKYHFIIITIYTLYIIIYWRLTTDDNDATTMMRRRHSIVQLELYRIIYLFDINTRQVDGGVNLGPRVVGVVGLCGTAMGGRRLCTAWRARSRRTVPEKKRARTDINIEGSGSIKRRNEFQARRTKMAGSKTLWIPSNILTVRLPIAALKSDERRARQLVFNIKMTMIIY